ASNFLACPAKYPSPNTKNTGKRTAKAVRIIVAGVSKPYRISNARKPGSEMEAAGASPYVLTLGPGEAVSQKWFWSPATYKRLLSAISVSLVLGMVYLISILEQLSVQC